MLPLSVVRRCDPSVVQVLGEERQLLRVRVVAGLASLEQLLCSFVGKYQLIIFDEGVIGTLNSIARLDERSSLCCEALENVKPPMAGVAQFSEFLDEPRLLLRRRVRE